MATDKIFQGFLKNVGHQLARLRREKGYTTVKEFAVRYKLPEIHYWRIEKGKANITLKSLSKILRIHKVSVQDFFCLVTNQNSVS